MHGWNHPSLDYRYCERLSHRNWMQVINNTNSLHGVRLLYYPLFLHLLRNYAILTLGGQPNAVVYYNLTTGSLRLKCPAIEDDLYRVKRICLYMWLNFTSPSPGNSISWGNSLMFCIYIFHSEIFCTSQFAIVSEIKRLFNLKFVNIWNCTKISEWKIASDLMFYYIPVLCSWEISKTTRQDKVNPFRLYPSEI